MLAAGLILLSDWDRESDFLDPMCGSGTLVIEAAMIACNIPPALHRKDFGFMNWKNFDEQLWNTIKDSALKKVKDFPGKIIACDRAFASIRKAEANIKEMLNKLEENMKKEYPDEKALWKKTEEMISDAGYALPVDILY